MSARLGNRPTPEQLLLLHAALDEPEKALPAWERWQAAVGVENADDASRRLLPLIYTRGLHRILDPADGEFDAVREGLRGIYRRAWIHNQTIFARAAEAIGLLRGAGIETLVTKGASLAVLSYGDIGARPMDDVDVLVPLDRARDAIEALGAAGWAASSDDPLGWTQVHHSLGFAGPGGGNLDRHWFALWQPAPDDGLWRASVPIELSGIPTRAPCAADQILLVCTHGTPWSLFPSFRWIADAIAVIRAAGEDLDWNRVGAEAERRRLTVAIGAALAYLREEFDAPVPASLLVSLAEVPAPRYERVAFRAAGRSDGPARTLAMAWDRYRRLRDLDTGAPVPSSFPAFARRFWGLESAWQLPLHGVRALSRRRARSGD